MYQLKDYIQYYIGQEAVSQIGGVTTITFQNASLLSGKWRIILRPLSSMTREEALELCRMAAPEVWGDYRFSKWSAEMDPHVSDTWRAYNVTNERVLSRFVIDLIDGTISVYNTELDLTEVHQSYWQWYFQKGFAIPMWPENKTLIEMGLAIDSTKIATT